MINNYQRHDLDSTSFTLKESPPARRTTPQEVRKSCQRDNKWLRDRFITIKKRYFDDVKINNSLIIKFGRPCNTRLGSIKPNKFGSDKYSIITINGHFQDSTIPEFVVDTVIAHEFMHYGHGFASPHKQAYRHPHKGGVVDWDLKERGLGDILKLEKVWLKKNWKEYLLNHSCFKKRVARRRIRRLRACLKTIIR